MTANRLATETTRSKAEEGTKQSCDVYLFSATRTGPYFLEQQEILAVIVTRGENYSL